MDSILQMERKEDNDLSSNVGDSSCAMITQESISGAEEAPKQEPKKKGESCDPISDIIPENNESSREHSDSSEQTTEPLNGSEASSQRNDQKNGHHVKHFKKSKHADASTSDTIPDDIKLTSVDDSSCTDQRKVSISGAKTVSSEKKPKKKGIHLFKKSKKSGYPSSPENKKSSKVDGECSHTVRAKQTLEPLNGPEAASSKHGLKNSRIKDTGRHLVKHFKNFIHSDSLPVVLDFSQNLDQNHLAEADLQLLKQEESLFTLESSQEQMLHTEDEEGSLQKNYETLKSHLWRAVQNSFNKENQETLQSAVTAILQEEERDRQWKELVEKEPPCWRPMNCRETHDTLILEVVKKRIQQTDTKEDGEQGVEKLKREVCEMNKLIYNDLLQVVRDVQGCYPPEYDITSMYAQLYHEAFSAKLRELARANISPKDCFFILYQKYTYLKDVLQQRELESYINREDLTPLLPAEELESLEEQYISLKEEQVKTWLSNASKKEEECWQMTNKPELTDEYYVCNIALEVIHLVDETMKEAVAVLENQDKAQRILFQLPNLLTSYKKSIEELLKRQQKNIPEILKSHLFSIKKIRDYIEERENCPDDVKAACLSTALDVRDSCHKYFLSTIHNELKVCYCKLWTRAWFSDHTEVIEVLTGELNEQIHYLRDLHIACLQELLSQLHVEVMTEYVRRMLKRKLKLKDRSMQETAAGFLCEDSIRINTLFTENGSENEWLSNILPKVSEVLKVQDLDALKLEICVLLKNYPDLTERQVRALLQLKSDISCSDVYKIKECYHQEQSTLKNQGVFEPAPPFFCLVTKTVSLSFCSCFCVHPSFFPKCKIPCRYNCRSRGASDPV